MIPHDSFPAVVRAPTKRSRGTSKNCCRRELPPARTAAGNQTRTAAGNQTVSSSKKRFATDADIEIKGTYGPADLPAGWSHERDLGQPGEYPYTRGIHATMYRGRQWTM